MSAQRANEPLPAGRLSLRHYCAIHRHLFQDIYVWAGRYRTVRISKGDSMFCYPEHITREMRDLFEDLKAKRHLTGRSLAEFSREAAHVLATLNAIHPFRDGNGRTQLAFMALLAEQAGHPLDFDRLDPDEFLAATIRSFKGDERPLAVYLRSLIQ